MTASVMNVIDLYKGFEGEPEIKIISENKQGKTEAALHLWIGYFDSVIQLIEPNEQGFWEGVPLSYHTLTGWYDEENWECREKGLFIEQLKSIDASSFLDDHRKAYRELLKIFENSLTNNNKIYFNYN